MKNFHNPIQIISFIILSTILLVACNAEKNETVSVVEAYIQALSDKDTNKISTLSCADWEQNALIEVDSLTSVGSKLENLQCKESGKDGNDILVSCTGAIALDYNGEIQKIDLSSKTYITRQEGGEWRMCGYR